MTLIELSIKISKTAPAKTYTLHTDRKKCCIFQEEKNEDLTQRPTNSPEYHDGYYTMIATNRQYFSSMPSVSFILDHTRLDKSKLQYVSLVTDRADTILICQKHVKYAQYTPFLYKDNFMI